MVTERNYVQQECFFLTADGSSTMHVGKFRGIYKSL